MSLAETNNLVDNLVEPGMQQLAQVPAEPGQQQGTEVLIEQEEQVAKVPGEREEQSFPQFGRLPLEIQMKIFTEALNKPNVQIVPARRETPIQGQPWSLWFRPVAKSRDTSGYRRLQDLARVNRTAYAAVRLATARHNVRLPFRTLNGRIDGAEDLVFLEFAQTTVNFYQGYFHPDHQILNPPGAYFDEANMAAKFQGIQKVALKYSDNHAACGAHSATFRCTVAHHGHHIRHIMGGWKMCPDELCGFLNRFPNLREIHLILVPDRSWQTQELVRAYVHNFYARELLPAPRQPSTRSSQSAANLIEVSNACPFRRKLAVFHTTSTSYIEVNAGLLPAAFHIARTRYPHLSIGGLTGYNAAAAMLTELCVRCFRNDTARGMDAVARAQVAATYRMTLQERSKLVAKVLIAVPERMLPLPDLSYFMKPV